MSSLMEYKGYHASAAFSGEERLFTGRVINVDDTITFAGASVDELEKTFRTAVDNYIDWCRQIGKPPVREYKGSFNVRIAPEIHKEAAVAAAEKGQTLNQFVGDAIKEKLGYF